MIVLVLSVPIGVLTAIYLEEYANRTRWWNRFIEVNIQNLAAVPSIVYGILGLAFIVRGIGVVAWCWRAASSSRSWFSPTVVVASREAIRAVPTRSGRGVRTRCHQVAGRMAAGLARVDPWHGDGLDPRAVSRRRGDGPLIMVGAITYVAFNPELFGAYTALPVQIYNWTRQPDPEFQTLAAAGAIVLLVIVLSMNAVAIFLRNRYRRQW